MLFAFFLNKIDEKNLGEGYFKNQTINSSIPILIWWTPFTLGKFFLGTINKVERLLATYFI